MGHKAQLFYLHNKYLILDKTIFYFKELCVCNYVICDLCIGQRLSNNYLKLRM